MIEHRLLTRLGWFRVKLGDHPAHRRADHVSFGVSKELAEQTLSVVGHILQKVGSRHKGN
jgi:hypothetical protein